MKAFYSDTFYLPLPAGHRFPNAKYRLLRERLLASDFRDRLDLSPADTVTDDQLLLVHTPEYIGKLKRGELSTVEQRRIGFPWSAELVERSRRSTGGTLCAARAALQNGTSAHLAGGTHHAFADHGQGFCVFNDVAVATRVLQAEGLIRRAVVIDLDVHQGNGTAAIFADDSNTFTFSMHGASNFPFDKRDGDLDLALPDGTTDETYLAALREALENRVPLETADLVFYLAGVDVYEHDRYGKLKLSRSGVAERDRLVIRSCRDLQLPIAVVMAGGYAHKIEDIVELHLATIRQLLAADAMSGASDA